MVPLCAAAKQHGQVGRLFFLIRWSKTTLTVDRPVVRGGVDAAGAVAPAHSLHHRLTYAYLQLGGEGSVAINRYAFRPGALSRVLQRERSHMGSQPSVEATTSRSQNPQIGSVHKA